MNDGRCSGGNCNLKGWLYQPQPVWNCPTPGGICSVRTKFSVIVYNHGHGKDRGEPCAMADYFTRNGFALFAPVRRGHTLGGGITNTGTYVDACIDPSHLNSNGELDSVPENSPRELPCLALQVDEVRAALSYLVNYGGGLAGSANATIDLSRIAMLGHSYGGSLTIMAASKVLPYAPKAAVDISGGALRWEHNSYYASVQPVNVMARKMPLFFLQPSNEISLEPALQLAPVAGRSGDHMFQATIYPPVNPNSGECVNPPANDPVCAGSGKLRNGEIHRRFVKETAQVAVWGSGVLDFLRRYGVY